MPVSLTNNALMDLDTFYQMYQQQVDPNFTSDGGVRDDFISRTINSASTVFDKFCNRRLKAQWYSYDIADEDPIDELDPNEDNIVYEYNLGYCIFDPPKFNNFWFPTYPVNSITSFLIRDVAVTESTDYLATDGYILYKNKGLLIYDQGFDFGYYKTIKVKWNGGYEADSPEMFELQYLLFESIKTIINSPQNPLLQSETIGGYQYENYSATVINTLKGFAPNIFANLGRFRKESIG
jgi:hypothetical protein